MFFKNNERLMMILEIREFIYYIVNLLIKFTIFIIIVIITI